MPNNVERNEYPSSDSNFSRQCKDSRRCDFDKNITTVEDDVGNNNSNIFWNVPPLKCNNSDQASDDSSTLSSIDIEFSIEQPDLSEIDPSWDELETLLRRDRSYRIEDLDVMRYGFEPLADMDHHHRPIIRPRVEQPPEVRGKTQAVLSDWRKKMCLWSFRVVDHWRYSRDTVSIAMNLLDRYLVVSRSQDCDCFRNKGIGRGSPITTIEPWISQSEYQLAAMTCVYLAMKMNTPIHQHSQSSHGRISPSSNRRSRPSMVPMQLTSFVELSRGQFNSQDICSMEYKILSSLQWKVHPVISNDVGIALLHSLWHSTGISTPVYHALEELLNCICELSVIHLGNSGTYRWRPHVIASATILFAMEFFTDKAIVPQTRACFHQLLKSTLYAADNVANGKRCPRRVAQKFTGSYYVDEKWQEVLQLLSILQRTLWSELLCLLREETRTYQHHPPTNPIAAGHSLGLFDMEKAYKIYYQQKYGGRYKWEDSTPSTSSSPSLSESMDDMQHHPHRVSSSFSPVTTPKRKCDAVGLDEDSTSPISTIRMD
jgi:Cyclin, N-terminal domain